ncbi:MAG: hypothetical protein ACE5KZ_07080 [Candidatus Scalinduaceae bacterium]
MDIEKKDVEFGRYTLLFVTLFGCIFVSTVFWGFFSGPTLYKILFSFLFIIIYPVLAYISFLLMNLAAEWALEEKSHPASAALANMASFLAPFLYYYGNN